MKAKHMKHLRILKQITRNSILKVLNLQTFNRRGFIAETLMGRALAHLNDQNIMLLQE
jgi:hypothetical protein